MALQNIGLVVGKDFRPLPGTSSGEWCYLTVDLTEEERISVRISPDQARKVDIGDVVRFRRPRSPNRQVKRVTRLGSDPSLLP